MPVEVRDAKTNEVEEHDYWAATCTIKDGERLIWEERLPLPLYADFGTASSAVQDFLKRAPRIIAEQAKGAK